MLNRADPREAKLQGFIDAGKGSVLGALEDIQGEFEVRKDRQLRPQAIGWNWSDGLTLNIKDDPQTYRLTDHAESQVFDRVGLPRQYAKQLMTLERPRPDLILHNLNELMPQTIQDGALVRTVGTMTKGFLSPSYRRMDSSPIFEAFLESSIKAGFVPYRGLNSDYRHQVSMIYPQVIRPSENEFIAAGVQITSGDYGQQALSIAMMILRITCRNLATGMQMLRKVHLGARSNMGENEVIDISERTNRLDSATVASLTKDVVSSSRDQIKLLEQAVRSADQKEITEEKSKAIYEMLKKRGIRKSTVDTIKSNFENIPASVDLLPASKSLWRMSNAISLVANSDKMKADEKVDLENEAFNVLGIEKPQAQAALLN